MVEESLQMLGQPLNVTEFSFAQISKLSANGRKNFLRSSNQPPLLSKLNILLFISFSD